MLITKTVRLKPVLLSSAIFCLGFIYHSSANAEQVKMFNEVPTAKEMANHLFPSSSNKAKVGLTRSIRVVAPKVEEAIVIPMALPIQFASNSTEILSESKDYLDIVGQMLSMADHQSKRLMIEGHTDASGSAQYNQDLSKRRAKAVKSYLAKNHNIEHNRLLISGKGEQSPIDNTDPYDGSNRRVQFLPL